MNGRRGKVVAALCCAVTGVCFGSVTADRFGALYYPDETAAFATDAAGKWRVCDWLDAEVATGEVAEGRVAVPHESLGRRFGAFKLTVGTNETWFAFLRSAKVKPCGWVGVGTHGHHGWGRGDYRYLDLIAAAGIGVVRDDVGWQSSEREKGKYVFDGKLHGLVDGLGQRGIRFHPVLLGQNSLYGNPLDPDAYAAFAAAFVSEFRGRISSCDIFNEPHNFAFPRVYLPKGGKFQDWQCRPDAPWIPKHAELTRKAVDAIKAVDSSFSVGVGVEDYWAFFKTMLKGDLVRADDLVSIHPYDHEHYPPEGNWLFRDNGREVREYVKAHGGATRFVITECGWTTYDAKRDATHAFVGGYPPCTLVQQAQYLIRFWILSRQLGIEFACQYDFRDDGPRRNYTEDNFGLVREDYTPKPSFAAVAAMTRLLGDAEPLGSKSADERKYRFYVFRKGDRRVTAAWSLGGEAVVDAPAGFALKDARCLDLQGNEIPVPTRDGKLLLSEVPVYLVHPRPTVEMGTPFADSAVLQRGRRIPVWGTAKRGGRHRRACGRGVVLLGAVQCRLSDLGGRSALP